MCNYKHMPNVKGTCQIKSIKNTGVQTNTPMAFQVTKLAQPQSTQTTSRTRVKVTTTTSSSSAAGSSIVILVPNR